ncbi:MAG: PEP-CTERM sorting domain-containing protein [Myxococcota bacterium]
MTTKHLIASLATLALAGTAQADMVAGWDFSQYFGDGFLTTDAATFTDTLDANYSDFDPTFNAGAESAAFGTFYMNGTNGSDPVPGLGTGTETFLPTGAVPGSLTSNLSAPVVNPFDSFTILTSEGQAFTNLLAMTATDAISVVFSADLAQAGLEGSGFELTLGGKTFSGATDVGVEFSADGVSYSPVGTLSLTDLDTPYSVVAGGAGLGQAFFRLNFTGVGGQAIIDNVAIQAAEVSAVPEPGTLMLLGAGISGLAFVGRRRA